MVGDVGVARGCGGWVVGEEEDEDGGGACGE